MWSKPEKLKEKVHNYTPKTQFDFERDISTNQTVKNPAQDIETPLRKQKVKLWRVSRLHQRIWLEEQKKTCKNWMKIPYKTKPCRKFKKIWEPLTKIE